MYFLAIDKDTRIKINSYDAIYSFKINSTEILVIMLNIAGKKYTMLLSNTSLGN